MSREEIRSFKTPKGKASPIAKAVAVHRAADMHARANPYTFAQAARTELELSKMIRAQSMDAQAVLKGKIDMYLKMNKRTMDLIDLRRELLDLAEDYDRVLKPTLDGCVKGAYGTGKAGALIDMSKLGLGRPPKGMGFAVSFSQPDRSAMAAMSKDLFTDIAGQTRMTARASVAILRNEAAFSLRRDLALGQHPTAAAARLQARLVAKGFTPEKKFEEFRKQLQGRFRNPFNNAVMSKGIKNWHDVAHHLDDDGGMKFIDKAGHAWSIEEYCQMAAHTKLMMAHNEGTVQTMSSAGVNHYRVSDHSTECEICQAFEGRIWWTGEGKSKGYPVAETMPPFHPRCAHTILALVRV